MRGGVFNWPLRLGLIALCAVVPLCVTPWYTLALLMALPILRAVLDAMHEHWLSRACVLGGCLCAALLLPAWLRPTIILWGAALIAMSVTHVRAGTRTVRASLVLAVAAVVITLVMLLPHSGGQPIPWLAETIVEQIDQHPNGSAILLNAYQLGLARLEGKQALLPALRLGNVISIAEETRLQMLYSLRTSLEALLRRLLPQGMVCWALLMALLPALAADGVLHLRGRRSDLPPLSRWYLPRELATGAVVLLLLGFLPYLTDAPIPAQFGEMCYALGYWACVLQGVALTVFLMKQRGVKPLLCGLLIVLVILTLPLALFFLGSFDQFRDPRQLRGPRDDMN